MDLVVVGINHHTAPLEVRERYAIPGDDLPDRLRSVVGNGAVVEAVLINTCNRVELYCVPAPGVDPATAAVKAREHLGPAHSAVYVRRGEEAVQHLFRVASSLDSLVLGEPQILGQVKEAYAQAIAVGTVGPALSGAFARAFKTAKRVRTETTIARAAVSVGYVAVELAKTIFGSLDQVRVLLVGAGKMGILAAKNLSDSGAQHVQVANRTYARGKEVADRFGWSASAYEDLDILLGAVDVVICSTGAPRPILNQQNVRAATRQRRYRPLFLIDIAVPRDVEQNVGELDDVYLYNVDDLEEVSRSNEKGRRQAADAGESIIADELASFERWRRERQAAPMIHALRVKALELAASEAARTARMLPNLDEKGQAAIAKLAEVVAMKLVRGAMTALKEHGDAPGPTDVAAVLNRIFELENPPK